MLKRLCTVLLFGGLLGLTPGPAAAAPGGAAEPAPRPAQSFDLSRHRDDDHRRCMYRCDERDRRHRYRHRHRHHHDDARHRRYCWYRGHERWYKAPCGHPHRHGHH